MDRSSTAHAAFQVEQLKVEVHPDRQAMGLAAARAVAHEIRTGLQRQDRVSLIFAAAPSQDEFLAALATQPDVDWQRVIAFHMDEYIDLPSDAPQSFGQFLSERLFNRVEPGTVYVLDGNASDPTQESARYSALLRKFPPDITCAGIGENGHLAFNDPPVADFDDDRLVKVVQLTQRSRQQQVNDGCFDQIEDVPEGALTLTIPALLFAPYFACIVPSESKAEAVRQMLTGPITTECPASILRRHPNATLYLESQSAALISDMKSGS